MTSQTRKLLFKRPLQIVLAVGLFVAVWHLTLTGLGIPKYLAPSPLDVAEAFRANWTTILSQAGFTLSAAALGLTASMIFAIGTAVAFSMSARLAQASMPVVLVFRSAPVAAVAPIMMLMFGRGISTSITVVTIVSFFPIMVNIMRGLQTAPTPTAELLHVYGASRWQQLRLVRIPFALPYLFTGLRVAGSSAILGAMLSEWITGSKGLGKLILEAGDMREIGLLWAAVITSVAIAMAVFWGTSAGEKRMLRWTNP
jgi:NitT/TauT family transport system permease protein